MSENEKKIVLHFVGGDKKTIFPDDPKREIDKIIGSEGEWLVYSDELTINVKNITYIEVRDKYSKPSVKAF